MSPLNYKKQVPRLAGYAIRCKRRIYIVFVSKTARQTDMRYCQLDGCQEYANLNSPTFRGAILQAGPNCSVTLLLTRQHISLYQPVSRLRAKSGCNHRPSNSPLLVYSAGRRWRGSGHFFSGANRQPCKLDLVQRPKVFFNHPCKYVCKIGVLAAQVSARSPSAA